MLASSGQVEGSDLELAELSKLVRSNSRLHTPTSEKKIVCAIECILSYRSETFLCIVNVYDLSNCMRGIYFAVKYCFSTYL